jgi:hypothetical protein
MTAAAFAPHGAEERPLVSGGPIVVVAAIGLIAVAAVVLSLFRHPGMPALIAEDYMRVAGSLLVPEIATSDANRLTASLLERQPACRARIPDLRDQGFMLAGGAVRTVDHRPGVVAIYRNGLMDLVVIHAFAGAASDVPASSEVRQQDGRQFYIHRKSTNVLVFWHEGESVMVLTSSLPAEQVFRLALSASRRRVVATTS